MKGFKMIGAAVLMVIGLVISLAARMSDSCAESTVPAQQCVGTAHDAVLVWAGIVLIVVGGVWLILQIKAATHADTGTSEGP